MTDIIRLNEAINDYAARPVVTRLGEPDMAIKPSTYIDALGESIPINAEQILIDGIYGQTNDPAPFTKTGTGAMTLERDEYGVYLAMPEVGINTGIVLPTRGDINTLLIIKYRINDIISDAASRLVSIGSGSGSTANFRISTHSSPEKRIESNIGTFSEPVDNNVHTIAIYRGSEDAYLLLGNERYTASNLGVTYPNGFTGVGFNTSAAYKTASNDIDLYSFELYLDVRLTEKQVREYIKTV